MPCWVRRLGVSIHFSFETFATFENNLYICNRLSQSFVDRAGQDIDGKHVQAERNEACFRLPRRSLAYGNETTKPFVGRVSKGVTERYHSVFSNFAT